MAEYKLAVLRAHPCFRGQDPSLLSEHSIIETVKAADDPVLYRAICVSETNIVFWEDAQAALIAMAEELANDSKALPLGTPEFAGMMASIGFLATAADNVRRLESERNLATLKRIVGE